MISILLKIYGMLNRHIKETCNAAFSLHLPNRDKELAEYLGNALTFSLKLPEGTKYYLSYDVQPLDMIIENEYVKIEYKREQYSLADTIANVFRKNPIAT